MAAKKQPKRAKASVESVVPCLTFKERGEEAVKYYVETFKGAKVNRLVRYGSDGALPKGSLLHAEFEIGGQKYTAMDGGAPFEFAMGFSMVATCRSQKELDAVWSRMAKGGQEQPCGWLVDRFGVSWQVVPASLGAMLSDPKGGNTAKLMEAVMATFGKFDIAKLERAFRSR